MRPINTEKKPAKFIDPAWNSRQNAEMLQCERMRAAWLVSLHAMALSEGAPLQDLIDHIGKSVTGRAETEANGLVFDEYLKRLFKTYKAAADYEVEKARQLYFQAAENAHAMRQRAESQTAERVTI